MGLVREGVRNGTRRIAMLLRHLGVKLPNVFFRHLHFVGPFDVELPGNRIVRLYSWGHKVENELFWLGWQGHEPATRKWWLKFSEEGGDVLDIGANTGTYAFLAKRMNGESRVVAFEPVARIAALARRNREVSGLDVEIVEAAVADKIGRMPIYDPGGDNAYSASLDANFLSGEKESYEVNVETIDSYCEKNDIKPRLIKIDVEGCEGPVLLGGAKTLASQKCRILCEWLGNSKSHSEAANLLESLGYVAVNPSDLSRIDFRQEMTKETRDILILRKDELEGMSLLAL